MAYSFPAGNTLAVPLFATETVLVHPTNLGHLTSISYFNVFPSPNLPLAGGTTVFDVTDADRYGNEISTLITYYNRYAVRVLRLCGDSTIL